MSILVSHFPMTHLIDRRDVIYQNDENSRCLKENQKISFFRTINMDNLNERLKMIYANRGAGTIAVISLLIAFSVT